MAWIQLSGDEAQAELIELSEWLSREDELRGQVTVRQPAAEPGQMGGIIEILDVALGAQGAGTVLATSVSVWITHRRPSAEIEVTNENTGRSAKFTLRDKADLNIEGILRKVLED